MPIYRLDADNYLFPHPDYFDAEEDVVAIGGDLQPERIRQAYQAGIFPWYNPGEPITWWCPRKRMVLEPEAVHISKSMRNILNRKAFEITYNQAFPAVIEACQKIPRPGQDGTWLNDELKESLLALHQSGWAFSVEAWRNGKLQGGLYGLQAGGVFCGDSMFARESNASKVAFIEACRYFVQKGIKLIDCQVYTPHLASLGAREIPRSSFLLLLDRFGGKAPLLGKLNPPNKKGGFGL